MLYTHYTDKEQPALYYLNTETGRLYLVTDSTMKEVAGGDDD